MSEKRKINTRGENAYKRVHSSVRKTTDSIAQCWMLVSPIKTFVRNWELLVLQVKCFMANFFNEKCSQNGKKSPIYNFPHLKKAWKALHAVPPLSTRVEQGGVDLLKQLTLSSHSVFYCNKTSWWNLACGPVVCRDVHWVALLLVCIGDFSDDTAAKLCKVRRKNVLATLDAGVLSQLLSRCCCSCATPCCTSR